MEDSDHDMLLRWFTDFSLEAEHVRPDQARRAGEAMLDRLGGGSGGMIWLDEEGTPVSIACYKGRTPNGIRIGPVYTPPEHRRHGYAAAVTAVASSAGRGEHLLPERDGVRVFRERDERLRRRLTDRHLARLLGSLAIELGLIRLFR